MNSSTRVGYEHWEEEYDTAMCNWLVVSKITDTDMTFSKVATGMKPGMGKSFPVFTAQSKHAQSNSELHVP